MASIVFGGVVQVWMIYTFGLLFGLVAGFAIPAETSIVPTLVDERDLQAGNSIIRDNTQLAGFVGPTIVGIIIRRFSNTFTGVAFALDAFTFIVSAVTLQMIQVKNKQYLLKLRTRMAEKRQGVYRDQLVNSFRLCLRSSQY